MHWMACLSMIQATRHVSRDDSCVVVLRHERGHIAESRARCAGACRRESPRLCAASVISLRSPASAAGGVCAPRACALILAAVPSAWVWLRRRSSHPQGQPRQEARRYRRSAPRARCDGHDRSSGDVSRRWIGPQVRRASREMLVTPYSAVALLAPSERNWYSVLSRTVSMWKPAASIASVYRSRCMAPPMQAAQSAASQMMPSGSWTAVTISAMASRPPGRSDFAAAANTAYLSGARLMTPLEMTQSQVPSWTD